MGTKELLVTGLDMITTFIWDQCTEKVRHQV